MLSDSIVAEVVDILEPEDFYSNSHKIIFEKIVELFNSGKNPDLVTLFDALKGREDEVGGVIYLSDLTNCIPVNVPQHCEIIKNLSIKRKIITSFVRIVENAYGDLPIDALLDEINEATLSISKNEKTGPQHISEVLNQSVIEIAVQKENKDPVFGIPTGLADLDGKTGGLHKSEYMIIAGRPGTGKTSLALQFAESAASEGEGVLIFSLEMTAKRLVKRVLSARSGVSGNKIRTGYISDSDMQSITRVASTLSSAPIFIDDTPGLGITEITARAKRLAMQHKIGLIIVDYVQLSKGMRAESRALEIGQISAGLLGLAKSLNVAMVGLSQLNRMVESRQNKRPMISDLKESGSLEQDADVILLLYRDELYNSESPDKGIAEIIIGKGRDIGNWTIKVGFNGERTQFFNLTRMDV